MTATHPIPLWMDPILQLHTASHDSEGMSRARWVVLQLHAASHVAVSFVIAGRACWVVVLQRHTASHVAVSLISLDL